MTVPDGLVAVTFRRALDALLPPGPPARTLALAGPGLPGAAADIVLVPQHPHTGEHWLPFGAAEVVPLAWDIWVYLAFGATIGDDPPPMAPGEPFRPDWGVFRSALARLPEVRRPWLRRIYDHVANHPYADPF